MRCDLGQAPPIEVPLLEVLPCTYVDTYTHTLSQVHPMGCSATVEWNPISSFGNGVGEAEQPSHHGLFSSIFKIYFIVMTF